MDGGPGNVSFGALRAESRKERTRVQDFELFGALDGRLGIDVVDAAEGDQNRLVTELVRDLFVVRLHPLERVVLLLEFLLADLEQIVDGLSHDGAILALEAGVLDDRIVPVANVSEALQAADQVAEVSLLELHGPLSVGLARRRRLLGFLGVFLLRSRRRVA